MMTNNDDLISQRAVQAFAQRNNLSLDDAERMLFDVNRRYELPEGWLEDEEQKWAGLLESLRHQ